MPTDRTDDVLLEWEKELCSAFRGRDPVEDRHAPSLVAIIDRLSTRLAAAEMVCEAARQMADRDNEKCRYDHNDFCQSHYSGKPCVVESLNEALTAWESTRGTP